MKSIEDPNGEYAGLQKEKDLSEEELSEFRENYQERLAEKIEAQLERFNAETEASPITLVKRGLSFPSHMQRPALNMTHELIDEVGEQATMYAGRLPDGTYSMAIVTADHKVGRPVAPSRMFGENLQTEEGQTTSPYELYTALRVTFNPESPEDVILAGYKDDAWYDVPESREVRRAPYSDAEYFTGTCLLYLAEDDEHSRRIQPVTAVDDPELQYFFS